MKIEELALKVADQVQFSTSKPFTCDQIVEFATRFLAAYTAQQEPVKYLCKGARFKTYLTTDRGVVLEGLPRELAGIWVAMVEATNDCHLRHAAPVVPDDRISDLERQVAALTKERDEAISFWQGSDAGWADDQRKLVASQAREQTLRELWEAVEKEYFARLKEQDEEAAKFEVEKDMYGWNFHKGLSGGLVEFHIYMTKIAKVLALHTDDSALQARLAEERDRCAKVLADHPGHIPSNRWNAPSALGSCEEKIRSMT